MKGPTTKAILLKTAKKISFVLMTINKQKSTQSWFLKQKEKIVKGTCNVKGFEEICSITQCKTPKSPISTSKLKSFDEQIIYLVGQIIFKCIGGDKKLLKISTNLYYL